MKKNAASNLRRLSVIAGVAVALTRAARADQTVTLGPVMDTFVREQAPALNYGGAGSMNVAGVDSVNGDGEPRGRFDTFMAFDAAPALAAFDAAYGADHWSLTGIELQVTEVAEPQNPLFPRGTGTFSARWFAFDEWTEGTGSPATPVTGSGTLLTWQFLQSIAPTPVEAPLGTFSNTGASGRRQFALTPVASLVGDVRAGGLVCLRLLPDSAGIGFTFNSRSFGIAADRPVLVLTASPATPPTAGDLNCDGSVNAQDMSPFVLALVNPSAYAASFPACQATRADFNQDGALDGRDIRLFAAALTGP